MVGIPRNDIIDILSQQGSHVSWMADEARIREVIALMHPYEMGHDLIRIGGEGDGGYLVPDDLEGIAACFSPGVSVISGFEEILAERHGIRSFLADRSVDGPPSDNSLFDFTKKHLGAATDDGQMRLEDWVADKAEPEGDLILQMDIEGAEFGVLIDTPAAVLDRFRVIVLELHGLNAIYSREALPFFEAVFRKLTANHTVVHLHPNNDQTPLVRGNLAIPRVMEATLLRNDRGARGAPRKDFPHPLDRRTRPERDDLVLPDCWIG